MSRFLSDLVGTMLTKLQIGGPSGPALKNNAGDLEARNAADSAYIKMRVLLAAITGDDIILNEQATESGASWKYTLRRPSTGMTHDLTVVMPSGDPAVGQALTVASFASNVVTLQWTTIAAGNDKEVVDTTSIAFGSTSPVAMFSLPANAVVFLAQVIVDTGFNGTTPQMSVGISGTTSKYVATGDVDLTTVGVYEKVPGLQANASSESLIATLSLGGATAGAGRILIYYGNPS